MFLARKRSDLFRPWETSPARKMQLTGYVFLSDLNCERFRMLTLCAFVQLFRGYLAIYAIDNEAIRISLSASFGLRRSSASPSRNNYCCVMAQKCQHMSPQHVRDLYVCSLSTPGL